MIIKGPYTHSSGGLKGRKYVNIFHEDGRKTSKLYSRHLMEQHLGRELGFDETVDHINEDPTDDRIENLQVLSRKKNAEKSAKLRRPIEYLDLICSYCGSSFRREARFVRHSVKQGKSGPYCGRSCAGRASHKRA